MHFNSFFQVTPTSPSGHPSYVVHYSVNGKDSSNAILCNRISHSMDSDNHLRVNRCGSSRLPASKRRSSSVDSSRERAPSPSPSVSEDVGNIGKTKLTTRRMGKRNIKAQVSMNINKKKTFQI